MKRQVLFMMMLLMVGTHLKAQFPITLVDTSYTDLSLPDLEPDYNYGFSYPITADVLSASPTTYIPSANNRYFMSLFGPRYKQTSTSNIGYYDFHQGEDFTPNITYNGVVFDTINKLSEVCMCDGVVTGLLDSTEAYLETIEQGRSVTVKCDSLFKGNPAWGHIYMNYRHLSAIESGLKTRGINAVIHKGDSIGTIGRSGQTETVHLHYSITRSTPQGMKNMHPMRVFDPTSAPHLHRKMDTAVTMQLLAAWNDSALVRLAIPFNQVNIKKIKVSCGESFSREFDFEVVGNLTGRDTNNIVPGLAMYAYPFNRYQSVYSRYKQLDSLMPVVYPAARFRSFSSGYFPILNSWPYNKPRYVLDIMVSQLPVGYSYHQLVIEIQDIYGTVVKGATTQSALPAELISFEGGMENEEVKLNWVTASEVNTDYFIVERGLNESSLNPLQNVRAAGRSNVLKQYSFIDQTAEKNNFYRIQMVDKDGKTTSSQIIYVKGNRKPSRALNLFPNPANTYIDIESKEDVIRVTAIDTKGYTVLLDSADGKRYDVSNLPGGQYILECTTREKVYYRNLVILR